jgi:hypothetical protein
MPGMGKFGELIQARLNNKIYTFEQMAARSQLSTD